METSGLFVLVFILSIPFLLTFIRLRTVLGENKVLKAKLDKAEKVAKDQCGYALTYYNQVKELKKSLETQFPMVDEDSFTRKAEIVIQSTIMALVAYDEGGKTQPTEAIEFLRRNLSTFCRDYYKGYVKDSLTATEKKQIMKEWKEFLNHFGAEGE